MILINDRPIKTSIFPGGEVHVEIPFQDPKIVTTKVLSHIRSSNDVMELMLVMNALLEQGIVGENIELTIPYFPYARQDRVCGFGQAASLKVMADIINSFECSRVMVFDPHSKKLEKLLDNIVVIPQLQLVLGGGQEVPFLIERENLVLISPDSGAREKVVSIQTQIKSLWNIEALIVICDKVRDLATGKITDTSLQGDIIDANFIIIDDICDGGRTFVEISKQAKIQGAGHMRYLYVTHGIFSNGLDFLKPYFDHVYCVNCFLSQEVIAAEKEFLTVMDYKE